GQAAVGRVEVAAQDQRAVVTAGGGRGLGVTDDTVAGDRLAEEPRVAGRVGGEGGRLIRGDLRRVHAGDPFPRGQLAVPGVQAQPQVADVHGGAVRERAAGDGDVVLDGLVALQAGLEPHEQRGSGGDGVPTGDAVDVL